MGVGVGVNVAVGKGVTVAAGVEDAVGVSVEVGMGINDEQEEKNEDRKMERMMMDKVVLFRKFCSSLRMEISCLHKWDGVGSM